MTAAPGARVGARWFVVFTLAWLAIWTVQLTPVQLLLPGQLDTPGGAGTWVYGVVYSGIVLGVGGLAGVVAGPLAGALSDRTRGRFGRRRPWAVGGSWLTGVFLLLTGLVDGPWPVGLCWTGVSVGIAVTSAAFTALIADQLPPAQRGGASAAASSSQALGVVLGVAVVVLLGLGAAAGYLVLAVFIAVVGTLAALLLPDPPADPGSRGAPGRGSRPWASLRDRDFAWVVSGRLVTNVGNALPTSLFLFFLMYGLGEPKARAEDDLLLVIVVYTVFVVIASVATGWWSDRHGGRRVLTLASAVVQAVAALVILAAPSLTATIAAGAVLGLGYGAFSTVGLAYATDLLPHPDDHARDLGIVNTAAALGQLIGPLLGALLVALASGFWLLLVVSFALSVLGGVMSARAREPRSSRQPDPAPR